MGGFNVKKKIGFLIIILLIDIPITGICMNNKFESKIDNIIKIENMNLIDPIIEWQRLFGGQGYDQAESIKCTSDGGFIISGKTYLKDNVNSDLWMIKTNRTGNIEWEKIFGGKLYDGGRSVIETSDHGFLSVGYSKSFGSGNNDIFLIKTDSIGNIVINKTIGGNYSDVGYSVIETSDSNILLTGYTSSFGIGGKDLFLIKLKPNGDIIFNKTFGGKNDEIGRAILETSDNCYIILGSTTSWGNGWVDIWVLKTDNFGNELWNKTYGNLYIDIGLSIKETVDNCFIITGNSLAGVFSNSEICLIKINENGNLIWEKLYCGDFEDVGFSVIQTEDEGYFISGYTSSFGMGCCDFYMIKTCDKGLIKWSKTIGGKYNDVCLSSCCSNDGGCVLTGSTESFGNGSYDIWMVKIKSMENSGLNQYSNIANF